jgi:hypothetical protein
MSDEILGGAANMIGTGIGLGVMTMGAMVPLIVMKNMADQGGIATGKSGKGIKLNMPKMNVDFNLPKLTVKKIKVK